MIWELSILDRSHFAYIRVFTFRSIKLTAVNGPVYTVPDGFGTIPKLSQFLRINTGETAQISELFLIRSSLNKNSRHNFPYKHPG